MKSRERIECGSERAGKRFLWWLRPRLMVAWLKRVMELVSNGLWEVNTEKSRFFWPK